MLCDWLCEDVDDCSVGDATCCEQLCVNTPGSHTSLVTWDSLYLMMDVAVKVL